MSTLLGAGLAGTALGRALAAPGELLHDPSARFVKDHLRTAVAAVSAEGRPLFVKRFKPYAWYRRVEWQVVGSPARRCWQASAALAQAGFAVPAALACVETRSFGLPDESYFVSAAIEGAVPSGRWWLEGGHALPSRARRTALRALARELGRFHERGFYTKDANADNFLIANGPAGPRFYVIDLENVRAMGTVAERRRRKNLVQLGRPVRGRVGLRDRLAFLRAYFGEPLRTLRTVLRELAELDEKKEAEYRTRRRSGRPV